MISIHFQGKRFSITAFQVCATTTNAEGAEIEQSYEDLQDLLELTPKSRCPFHHRGLDCKSRKSRDTWSNRQVWAWSTEWSIAKANRDLPRECTGHNKHSLPKHRRQLYNRSSPDGQYQNWLIIFFAVKDGEALYIQKKQDEELTVAWIMSSLLPNSDLNWKK